MAGTFEAYRKKATFDVHELRILLDNEEAVELKYQIWDTLAKDPLFASPGQELLVDQLQELNLKRLKRLTEYDFPPLDSPAKQVAFFAALYAYDIGLPTLAGLNRWVRVLYREYTENQLFCGCVWCCYDFNFCFSAVCWNH